MCFTPRPEQQSQQKTPSEKSRSKKGKEPKPRVKKLKYHQYVPPDQKQEASEAPMDSSYARLLQQQQLFLQLQILSQQQQHYNYQTILPAPLKYAQEAFETRGNVLFWPVDLVSVASSSLLSLPLSTALPPSLTVYRKMPESKPTIYFFPSHWRRPSASFQ